MAKLVSMDQIKARLGLSDDSPDDINQRVSTILEATTSYLSAILCTEFNRQTSDALYWINPVEEPRTLDMIQLYLPNGFVSEDITNVKIAGSIAELTNATTVDFGSLVLEKVKGLLMVDMSYSNYSGSTLTDRSDKFFMRVNYTSGFETESTAYGFVYVDVPEWLQEAAIIKAKELFDSDCDDSSSKSSTSANRCQSEVMILLERYIRFYPTARKVIL